MSCVTVIGVDLSGDGREEQLCSRTHMFRNDDRFGEEDKSISSHQQFPDKFHRLHMSYPSSEQELRT